MSRYIKVEDAIEAAINGCSSWDGGYFPSMDDPIKEEFDAVAYKCIELVRCGECKNCNFIGGFGYYCHYCRETIQTDWFCSHGERKDLHELARTYTRVSGKDGEHE